MRKSKALSEIRKRKRNNGLIFKPKEVEHPLILALKAVNYYMEGIKLILKTITEAENTDAVFEQLEQKGIFKKYQETGDIMNKALNKYLDKMKSVSPKTSTDNAEND